MRAILDWLWKGGPGRLGWGIYILVFVAILLTIFFLVTSVEAHDCKCEPKPKEPECGEAWPCQGEGILCPAEGNQDPNEPSRHEGPCFCLSCDGFQLVWVMEYYPDGINISGKKTEWGPCKKGSETPYCEIDSRELTVCGSALIQWLRFLHGWFDKLGK